MRIIFTLSTCILMLCGQLMATEPGQPNNDASDAPTATAEKKEVVSIPNRKLHLELVSDAEVLHVTLTGKAEKLDWILFQPKGEVVSRISTAAKIDEIKIDNLETGSYILMVKDQEGRMLYQAFEKA